MRTIEKLIISLNLVWLFTSNSFAIADAGSPKIGEIPPPLTPKEIWNNPLFNVPRKCDRAGL
jgi:hypothetical protein